MIEAYIELRGIGAYEYDRKRAEKFADDYFKEREKNPDANPTPTDSKD